MSANQSTVVQVVYLSSQSEVDEEPEAFNKLFEGVSQSKYKLLFFPLPPTSKSTSSTTSTPSIDDESLEVQAREISELYTESNETILVFSPSVVDAPYRNLISACVLLNVGIAFSEEHALHLVDQVLNTTPNKSSASELLRPLSRFHRSIQLSGSFLSKRITKLLQYTYSIFSQNNANIDSNNSTNIPIHRQAAIDRKEQLLALLCDYIKASSIGRSVFSEHIPKIVPVIGNILENNKEPSSSKVKALSLLKQLVMRKSDRPALIKLGELSIKPDVTLLLRCSSKLLCFQVS